MSTITPEMQQAADELRIWIANRKIEAFDAWLFAALTPNGLKLIGYEDVPSIFTQANIEITRKLAEFDKKFPI